MYAMFTYGRGSSRKMVDRILRYLINITLAVIVLTVFVSFFVK